VRTLAGLVVAATAVVVAAVAISSGGASANAESGGRLNGAVFSAKLFAGIRQHGRSSAA
jgi:hypothetical protein